MKHIASAAILYNGKAYTGRSHCEIGIKMVQEGVCPRPYPGGDAQGFVDDEGVFWSRCEAAVIATAAGQVQIGKSNREHIFNGEKLYSEDLL